MMNNIALIADAGGTNLRVATCDDGLASSPLRLRVSDYGSATDALGDAIVRMGSPRVTRLALAIAGPVNAGKATMTNAPWSLDADALSNDLGIDRIDFLNDLEATAWGLGSLPPSAIRRIGAGGIDPTAPAAIIAPGTGLGCALWMPPTPTGGLGRVVAGEGGHVTLPATTAEESAIIAALSERFGHVSAERVLSGPGLENIHRALRDIRAVNGNEQTAARILEAAENERCALAVATRDQFCAFLGTVAGNLALTAGAKGGTYIAGGIVPRFADAFARSAFRERFVAKGRFRDYLDPIATILIQHSEPVLHGLSAYLHMADQSTSSTRPKADFA